MRPGHRRTWHLLGAAAVPALLFAAWVAAAPAEQATPAPANPPEVRGRRGFSIRITNPVTGDFRFGRAEIAAEVTAVDPALVEKVEFYADDRLVFIDTEPPWQCFFDFGTEPRSWILKAVAFHREGVKVADTVILRRVVLNYAVEVNRVVLYATVRSADGNHAIVQDLRREDLLLEEDGVRQEIVDFYPEKRPVTLAMILDSSTSMQPAINTVHAAAGRFVAGLSAEDRGLVIDFDEKVYLLQDLTADKTLLRQAIDSTQANGNTALFDALYASYRKLKGIEGRKAVILLTDGEDTASKFSFKRVLDGVKINDIIIDPIGLGTGVLDVELRRILKTLAEETGGQAHFPNKPDELQQVYQEIAENLRNQYYITYAPTNENWDGRWRKIRLTSPKRNLDIRTRSGYYAVKKKPA